jgi:hypothetical protein
MRVTSIAFKGVMMNSGITVRFLLGAMLTASSSTAAQQLPPQAGADAKGVAVAVIKHFAEERYLLRDNRGTIVVSNLTTTQNNVPKGNYYTVEPGPRRDLGLSPAALAAVAGRGNMAIRTCDTLTAKPPSLCGIPKPWVWLIFDHPAITDDRAIIHLQVMGPDFHQVDDPPTLVGTIFDVYLTRHAGQWKVDRVEVTGQA